MRLKKKEDFAKVYRQEQSTANYQFVVYKMKNPEVEKFRAGISASKKIGNAVKRNRVRRIVKELIRKNQDRIREGYDFIIIVRARAVNMEFAQLEKSLLHVLGKASLLKKKK